MKTILIINGHPDKLSFCAELAKNYYDGASKSGSKVDLLNLVELKFDINLNYGYRQRTELEPDLLNAQALIKAADHLVFVYPTWWSTYPALLKGFIDRVFLPKFAFSYRENSPLWDGLLKGKSARVIVTMDTPQWYYRLIFKSPGHNSIKKGILEFCGVKPVKITSFSPIKSSTLKDREKWLKKSFELGLLGE